MVIRREGLAPWPAAGATGYPRHHPEVLPAGQGSSRTIDGGFAADELRSFLLTTAGIRVFRGGTSLSGDLRARGIP